MDAEDACSLLNALLASAPDRTASTEGGDRLYRVKTIPNGRFPEAESKYFESAYQARGSRDNVRQVGVEATVGWVPRAAFVLLADSELDQLAEAEIARANDAEARHG
jgi:hypothetical protein